MFDPEAGIYGRWFPGGVCNTCFNAVDRHVDAGRGEQAAIIYDSPLAGDKRTITYHRLMTETQVLGGMLRDLGVGKGDRVILYMPMVPEAVIAMLACARIGAIHSVVFGGFARARTGDPHRRRHAETDPFGELRPRAGRIVHYKPLLDEAIALATHKPDACLILQRPQAQAALIEGRDRDWATMRDHALIHARSAWDCVPVAATDPLYILYTSGTTGRPKGVVRDNGGHMVALKWSMKNLYGVEPGEVYWAASDIGWVVGHSYIVYAPLLHGCTTILYEGKPVGTPDAGAFWRVISEHGCVALFTAPTAFRAIKKEDPQGKLFAQYDLAKFRTLFLAGERADPRHSIWAEKLLNVPVIDHWWQTETGWCIAGNPVGLGMLPIKHGSPTVAMPGYDVRVVDEGSHELRAEQDGLDRDQAAAAAGLPADAVAGRRAHARKLSRRIPRLLQNRRRRLQGRGRLHLRHGPHRRHHQCRRPPALDRRHGRGARRRIPTSPNAPCSASRTSSRAKCRAASSCSNPASTGRRPRSRRNASR